MKIKAPMAIVSVHALAEHVALLGLDVSPNLGKDRILAKMAEAGFPTDYIEVENDEPEPVIQRIEPAPRKRHTPGKRMCQIMIPVQDKPGGSEPQYASVNGVPIWITRNDKVWVDFKYLEVLKNAVQRVPDQLGPDNNILSWKDVPEVPYTTFAIEPPLSKAEIEEEKERQLKLAEQRQAEAEAASGMAAMDAVA